MRLPFNGQYAVNQRFGENPAAYARFGLAGHNGIDYNLPTGTPVLAATAGIARVYNDPPGFGTYVEVVGDQYKTVYAHLQRAGIINGTHVEEGELIGYSNNTGNSSGPHLHWGVKPIPQDNNNGYFGAIDPELILSKQGNFKVTEAQYEDLKQQVIDARAEVANLRLLLEDVKQHIINVENKK